MFRRWRFGRALRHLQKSEHPALAAYGAAQWPSAAQRAGDAEFLALDFELDGLKDGAHLLQAGWVPFNLKGISLAHATSCDIRTASRLNREAVTIHGIGEQRAATGEHVRDVLARLIPALSGRILVAHGASIDADALRRVTRDVFGTALPVRSICTLQLERHLAPNLAGAEAYRLGTARTRYGLPDYAAHDALGDALAAAELLLAQLSRMPEDTTLARLEALG